MATAAQIQANRRNAQKSTGPKTERGKAHAKLNAIKHGLTARTIMPVLPQEDPKELENKIQQAIAAMQPRNPLELDLVCRAVRLSGELDRAERVATAHLAHRVRMATRSGTDTVSAEELKKVHDLGSKLFFQAAIGPGYSDSTADDYPAVIVRRLEESAEGCRWLLARWAEILNLLDREAAWDDPEIVRFVGLLGKRGIEAHFDPELNSLFHAFDALGHRIGHKFWNDRRDGLPLGYIGGFEFAPYRQIAPPPSDKNAALILICSVIERHVGRLEELLAEHEEIEAAEAAERYDRAALDCSPAFERHRRYQSARHRELLGTLEAFRKMRKEEFGTGNGEAEKADGNCRMADDREQMADDECQVADDECQVRSSGCGDGESGQPTPQAPSDEMSQEDRDYVYGPSRPGSRATMIAGMSGGCGEGEPETVVSGQWSVASESGGSGEWQVASGGCGEGEPERSEPSQERCLAPEKAPNKANPESTQSSLPLEVESSLPEPAGRKRSQSTQAVASGERRVATGQWPVNAKRGRPPC